MLTRAPEAGGRIDPRTRRTRELIRKAFNELLAEKTFEAITVQEISDRATVNRATFYAHFEDKYMLLDDAFSEMFRNVLYKHVPPGAEFSASNLQLLIGAICEFLEQLNHHCAPSGRQQFDSLVERQVKAQISAVLIVWLTSGRKNRLTRDEAELRASVTSWAIYGAAQWWSQGPRKESAEEFARHVLPIIQGSLKAEP